LIFRGSSTGILVPEDIVAFSKDVLVSDAAFLEQLFFKTINLQFTNLFLGVRSLSYLVECGELGVFIGIYLGFIRITDLLDEKEFSLEGGVA
jgi:hypothetical protein